MKTIKNNSLRLLALLLVGIAQIPLTPVAVSASPLVNDNAQFILPVNNNSVVKENDAFLRSVVDGAGGEVAGIVGDFRPFPKFIIVRPRRGISADLLARALASSRTGTPLVRTFGDIRPDYLYQPQQQTSSTATPNDPLFPQQTHLGQMRATTAWRLTSTRGKQVVRVALLDNCIASGTPQGDLQGKLITGGYDAVGDTFSIILGLGDPHAARMASIIAGVHNNRLGGVGVNENAVIRPINIAAPGTRQIRESSLMKGIRNCAIQGNRIAYVAVNPGFSNTVAPSPLGSLEHYVSIYGTTYGGVAFFPAGNDRTANNRSLPPSMAVVSSCDANGNRSGFSNSGSSQTLSAPGELVRTTGPEGGGVFVTGTSAAAANAAGVASLALSLNSSLSGTQIHNAMKRRDSRGVARIDAVETLRNLQLLP